MRGAMGATITEISSLERDGILVPGTRQPKIMSRWRISDGLSLVTELRSLATQVLVNEKGWESIQLASARRKVPVGEIIAAMRAGALIVGVKEGIEGYTGIRVRISDVAKLTPKAKPEKRLKPRQSIPVGAFARSIGIGQKGPLVSLIDAGHCSSTGTLSSASGTMRLAMSEADNAAFHERFMTVTTMSAEFGHHHNTVRARLRVASAPPFTSEGRVYDAIWLRDEVEPIFADSRH